MGQITYEYVPKNTFINREEFKSDLELMSFLNKIVNFNIWNT